MKKFITHQLKVKIWILSIAVFFTFPAIHAQMDTTKTEVKKGDTTRIVVGEKELEIIKGPSDNDAQLHLKDRDKENKDDEKGWKAGGFKGHWTGIELGLNNYLNKDYSMGPGTDAEYMSLNSSRSIDVNLNFVQHSFGIIGNRFGMVTGLGFEFYNYFFRHNNTIVTNDQGIIGSYPFDSIHLERSKLTMTFLTVPLLFEFQFPGHLNNSHRIRIAVGVIGGLKLGSHTKVVYEQNGDKKKDKNHDDFSINPFRYGFTARLGYKHINIFSDFYPVPLFEKGKGPVLYPFSVGLAFVGH
jgi:opacity protein-like surface antigen